MNAAGSCGSSASTSGAASAPPAGRGRRGAGAAPAHRTGDRAAAPPRAAHGRTVTVGKGGTIAPVSAAATHLSRRSRLVDAVEQARAAAVEDAAEDIGAVGRGGGGRRAPRGPRRGRRRASPTSSPPRHGGYRGWRWAVTLAARGDDAPVTVSEVVLLPGPGRAGRAGLGAVARAGAARRPRRRRPAAHPAGRPAARARLRRVGRPGRRGGRPRGRPRPAAGAQPRGPRRGRPTLAGRRARAGTGHGPRRPGALRHLRVPAAARRLAARRVRGLRQRATRPADGAVVAVEFGCGAHSDVASEPAPRSRSPSWSTTTASSWSRPAPVTVTADPFGTAALRAGGPRRLGRLADPVPRGRQRRGGPAARRLRRRLVRRAGAERRRRGAGGRRAGPAADRGCDRRGELRVANTGAPLDAAGVAALASLRASAKRDDAGLGRPVRRRVRRGARAVRRAADRHDRRRGGVLRRARPREAVARAARPGRRAGPPRRPAAGAAAGLADGSDEPPPPAGYATEVRLPLRPDVDPDALLASRGGRRAGPAARAAGPGRDRRRRARRCGAPTVPATGRGRRSASGAGGSARARRLAGPRPRTARRHAVEQRGRRERSVCWALPLDADGVPAPLGDDVLHAPTATTERLGLPARLIADVPLDPDRRRVRPGAATDAVLPAAADAYLDLVAAVAPDDRLALVPAAGLPALRARRPPARAAARRPARRRVAARRGRRRGAPRRAGAGPARRADRAARRCSPTSCSPACSPPDAAAAAPLLAELGVHRLGAAELADRLLGVAAPAAWWRAVYAALEPAADTVPGLLDELRALPVPLADGRTVPGPADRAAARRGADARSRRPATSRCPGCTSRTRTPCTRCWSGSAPRSPSPTGCSTTRRCATPSSGPSTTPRPGWTRCRWPRPCSALVAELGRRRGVARLARRARAHRRRRRARRAPTSWCCPTPRCARCSPTTPRSAVLAPAWPARVSRGGARRGRRARRVRGLVDDDAARARPRAGRRRALVGRRSTRRRPAGRRPRSRPGPRRRLAGRPGPARRRAGDPRRRARARRVHRVVAGPARAPARPPARVLAAAVGHRAGGALRPAARSTGARRRRRARRRRGARRPAPSPTPATPRTCSPASPTRTAARTPRSSPPRTPRSPPRSSTAGSTPPTSTRRTGSAPSTAPWPTPRTPSSSTHPWLAAVLPAGEVVVGGDPNALADLLDLPTASEIVDGEVAGTGRAVPWGALPEVVVTCHTLGVPVPAGELWCHDELWVVLHRPAPGRHRVPTWRDCRRSPARRRPGPRPARGARLRLRRGTDARRAVERGTKSRASSSTAAPRRRRAHPAGVPALGAHLPAGAARHRRRGRDERLRRADRAADGPPRHRGRDLHAGDVVGAPAGGGAGAGGAGAPRRRRAVRGAGQERPAQPAVRVHRGGAAGRGPPRARLVRRRALALLALRPGRLAGPRPLGRAARAHRAHAGPGEERRAGRRRPAGADGPGDRRGPGGRRGGPAGAQHRRSRPASSSTSTAPTPRGSSPSRPAWTWPASAPATGAAARAALGIAPDAVVLAFVGPDPAAQGAGRAAARRRRAARARPGAARAARGARRGRPVGQRAGRADRRCSSSPPRSGSTTSCASSRRRPAPAWREVLPGGRRRRRAEPQRVVRAGRAGGAGVRDAGGGGAGGRAAGGGGGRAVRAAGRRAPARGRGRTRWRPSPWTRPGATALSRGAVAHAHRFSWDRTTDALLGTYEERRGGVRATAVGGRCARRQWLA